MVTNCPETSYGPKVRACGKSNPAGFGNSEKREDGGTRGYFSRVTSKSSVKITTGIINSMV